VLVSNLSERKKIHWIKIILRGKSSNRNGLGARVRLYAGGQTYFRYNDGKSGYLAQSVLPLYFGLANTMKVDRVEVDWPSGNKQVVRTGLEENQTLTITEPR
jgi:enediyne biosynthesis protein E4